MRKAINTKKFLAKSEAVAYLLGALNKETPRGMRSFPMRGLRIEANTPAEDYVSAGSIFFGWGDDYPKYLSESAARPFPKGVDPREEFIRRGQNAWKEQLVQIPPKLWDRNFPQWIAALTEDVKVVSAAMTRRGKKHRPSKKMLERCERIRVGFALVPLRPNVLYALSCVEIAIQHQILRSEAETLQWYRAQAVYGLIKLLDRGELDHLKKCPICLRWFTVDRVRKPRKRGEESCCSKKCSDSRRYGTDEYKKSRSAKGEANAKG